MLNIKVGKNGWLGDILVSLSIANLALMLVFNRLLYVSESNLFFLPIHTWHYYLSSIILLILLSAIFLSILRILRITRQRAWEIILLILTSIYLLISVRAFIIIYAAEPWALLLVFLKNILVVNLIFFGSLLFAFLIRKQFVSIVYIVLFIFFPFAFLNIAYVSADLAKTLVNPPPTYQRFLTENKTPAIPKTIYLLFDELDYRFFFEEMRDRVEGVELKTFEYMKGTSLFFTNVPNAVDDTLIAIPLITTAHKPTNRASTKNDMNIGSGLWSESDHIFKMFKNAGQRTSVMGYYHPLCRIFDKFTDHCRLFPREKKPTLRKVMTNQFLLLLPRFYLRSFLEEHQELEKETFEVLRSDNIDFMFIHARIPHAPTIYNAKLKNYILPPVLENIRIYERRITPSMYDNVQLVDLFLEKIIRILKEEGIWDASTLIIGTDHRWRKPHDGKLLKNIPLLIKLPMQTTGHQYHKKINLTKVKPILEQIAIKRNNTVEGLSAWLDANNDE